MVKKYQEIQNMLHTLMPVNLRREEEVLQKTIPFDFNWRLAPCD